MQAVDGNNSLKRRKSPALKSWKAHDSLVFISFFCLLFDFVYTACIGNGVKAGGAADKSASPKLLLVKNVEKISNYLLQASTFLYNINEIIPPCYIVSWKTHYIFIYRYIYTKSINCLWQRRVLVCESCWVTDQHEGFSKKSNLFTVCALLIVQSWNRVYCTAPTSPYSGHARQIQKTFCFFDCSVWMKSVCHMFFCLLHICAVEQTMLWDSRHSHKHK